MELNRTRFFFNLCISSYFTGQPPYLCLCVFFSYCYNFCEFLSSVDNEVSDRVVCTVWLLIMWLSIAKMLIHVLLGIKVLVKGGLLLRWVFCRIWLLGGQKAVSLVQFLYVEIHSYGMPVFGFRHLSEIGCGYQFL